MKCTTKALFISALLLIPSLSHAVTIPVNMSLKATDAKTGGAVTELQSYLNIYPTTGYFGVKTQTALKAYQKKFKLPQTGTVNATTAKFINQYITPTISTPIPTTSLTPIVEQPVVASTTWPRGTFQRVHIPAKILAEKAPVNVRLLSRNAFKHDDIYTIGLAQPSTYTTFDWIVGNASGLSNSALPGQVPAGDYLLQICATTCYEYPSLINIPRIVAPKSDVAIMASLESEPVLVNYEITGDQIIDENGTETKMKNKIVYKGSEITVYARTKTYSSVQSPIQIWAFTNNGGVALLSTTSSSRTFKFILGETVQLPEGIYPINVCIANECNLAREKLEVRSSDLKTETSGNSSYSVPSYLHMTNMEVIGTTTVSRSYFEPGKTTASPAPLKVTIRSGSVESSSYMGSGYATTTIKGYTVYELNKNQTRLVKLNPNLYAVIEGRSVLVDYVVNSIRVQW